MKLENNLKFCCKEGAFVSHRANKTTLSNSSTLSTFPNSKPTLSTFPNSNNMNPQLKSQNSKTNISTPKVDAIANVQELLSSTDHGDSSSTKGIIALLAFVGVIVIASDLKMVYDTRTRPKQNILVDSEFADCQVTAIVPITHDTKLYKVHASCSEKDLPFPWHIVIKDDSCQVARSTLFAGD